MLTANASNQLQGYSYDAAGNMTHDLSTGSNYNYDQENRVTGAAKPSTPLEQRPAAAVQIRAYLSSFAW